MQVLQTGKPFRTPIHSVRTVLFPLCFYRALVILVHKNVCLQKLSPEVRGRKDLQGHPFHLQSINTSWKA